MKMGMDKKEMEESFLKINSQRICSQRKNYENATQELSI